MCKKRCGRGWQAHNPDWGLISPVEQGFHLHFHPERYLAKGTFLGYILLLYPSSNLTCWQGFHLQFHPERYFGTFDTFLGSKTTNYSPRGNLVILLLSGVLLLYQSSDLTCRQGFHLKFHPQRSTLVLLILSWVLLLHTSLMFCYSNLQISCPQ